MYPLGGWGSAFSICSFGNGVRLMIYAHVIGCIGFFELVHSGVWLGFGGVKVATKLCGLDAMTRLFCPSFRKGYVYNFQPRLRA